MKTGTLFTPTSMILVVGLLVLASVFSNARPALAQEACPLSPGVTPPAAPRVTAQQVEDGSASLMDFALAVRDQNREIGQSATSLEQVAYLGCLVRQEGSPWRSGSTYLVQLTPDGRVLVHAKDMALSGRQLNLSVYGAILQAVGINPADLLDPATFATAFGTAIMGNGGAFSIPYVPGASGYAFVYLSGNFRTPLVMLVGFDLDSSHLAEEDIDYGDPAITARDVVDRATLKAFVTQAGEYVLELQESGDPARASQARIALRDPNGPWRHGSVYLYVLDTVSNVVLFHATEPGRFELQPLVGIARDGRTGELILPQVLAAARSGPEGGFVEYYYDDPGDDTDSADIPKVGYAREFTGEVRRPDGSVLPIALIVGSGFYRSAHDVAVARQNTVVKSVLPQVMRAMTASTVDAVSGRVQQASSGMPPAKGFSLGGASTLSDALLTHGRALEKGSFDLNRLLRGSSFVLPLNAVGTGGSGLFGNLTFWGSGDYRNFSGGSEQSVDYDGNVVSANFGIDTRVSDDLLAGVSVGWARGTVDYTASSTITGEVATNVTSVNPYVGWQSSGGTNLWATAGYGWGEVEVDDESAATQASDLTHKVVAAGVSGPLVSSDKLIGGGTTSLRLKGETAFTWADIDGSGNLESMGLEASRQRLMLEGSHVRKLDSGGTLTPSVEVGMRYDGGDGETGSSIETGGGVLYADSASGLTLEGRARTVLAHSGDYEEWGVSGLLRLDPGAQGLGFSVSLRPSWGQTASGVQRLWETGVTGLAANDQTGRVKARIGYGFGAPWGGRGLLTPYTDVSLSGEGSRRLSLGGHYKIGASVSLSLEGVHSSPVRGGTNHGVILRGDMNW